MLVARRTRPAELAGLWEFPGGKVEPGEAPRDALIREIREELEAPIEVGPEIACHGGPWPVSERYVLRLYVATLAAGDLSPGPSPGPDHDEVRWLGPDDLGSVPWLPSDRAALSEVRRTLSHDN